MSEKSTFPCGHEKTLANTYTCDSSDHDRCLICKRECARDYERRRRNAAGVGRVAGMTRRQMALHTYLRDFDEEHHRRPTAREVALKLGFSDRAARSLLKRLEAVTNG